MTSKIFIGIALATAAIAVSCAPANARPSSPKPQRTYEAAPAPIPRSSPVAEVQGTKAQLPSKAKTFELPMSGIPYKIELKSCNRIKESKANVSCSLIFTNTTDKDSVPGEYVHNYFRAFDSAGTTIRINEAKKGTSEWAEVFNAVFVAQFPVSVKIKFKLPDEDATITFLDFIGSTGSVIRLSQVPIDPQ